MKAHDDAVRLQLAIAADLQSCHLELPGGKRAGRADIYPDVFGARRTTRDPAEIARRIEARYRKKKKPNGDRSRPD
jgi:hypothetical protein